MRNTAPWSRAWSGRAPGPRRLGLMVLLGVLGLLGIKMAAGPGLTPSPAPKNQPEPRSLSDSGLFSQLRPRAGDMMALPRIGFRWAFELARRDSGGRSDRSVTQGVAGALSRMAGSGSTRTRQASLVPPILVPPDSTGTSGDSGSVKFRFHLAGPGGSPEIDQETDRPEIQLTLTKDFPVGECEWWVEAIRPGLPVVTSPRERFTLQR